MVSKQTMPLASKIICFVHKQISPQDSRLLIQYWIFKQMHSNWKSMNIHKSSETKRAEPCDDI